MQDGCEVYMDSSMHQLDHVSWSLGLFSKKPPLGGTRRKLVHYNPLLRLGHCDLC